MSLQPPPLFATPATAARLERAQAIAILVGGYDGSGNYGDIAQLDAALRLLAPLAAGLLVLPVLERARIETDRELRAEFLHPTEDAIFFDPETAGNDGLIPLRAPPALASGAIYLYGGGYLNPSWGERKLAMLRAAESFIAAAAPRQMVRVASGLQTDPGWLDDLASDDTEALARFDFLGARDALSAQALTKLAPGKAVHETSDDAAAVIPVPPTTDPWTPTGTVDINFHVAGHQWVTPSPDETFAFAADLARELGQQADRPVVAHPLIAYLDERIDERDEVERLRAACAARDIEVGDTRVLRPARLPELAPSLREAGLTISCSYHVALTSLLLGVPTVIFGDNPYYEQKAAGLTEAFSLPPSFVLSADASPATTAAEIVAAVDARGGAGKLRRRLSRRGDRFRRRRTEAEAQLLARLSGTALEALSGRIEELSERLRERSAEPAALEAEIAALHTENEELRQPAMEAAVGAAERRAERAEAEIADLHAQLTTLLESRSWKLSEPLRRLGGAVRRRGG